MLPVLGNIVLGGANPRVSLDASLSLGAKFLDLCFGLVKKPFHGGWLFEGEYRSPYPSFCKAPKALESCDLDDGEGLEQTMTSKRIGWKLATPGNGFHFPLFRLTASRPAIDGD